MNKCEDLQKHNKCKDSAWSWIFLFIGILATVSMRVVAVFIHVNPGYAKAAWYIGVGFFFLFFVYRYIVSRSKVIALRERDLIRKVYDDEPLEKDDKEVIGEILCSLNSNKERINFIIIFVLSAVALVVAVIADIVR